MSTLALVLLSFWMFVAGMGWTATKSPPNPAHMDKDVRVQYYDIAGTSWQELADEMRAKGPGDFFGQTVYQIGYRYTSKRAGDRCWVDEATVTLDVTVTLPRWQRRSDAERSVPYDLRRDWDLFRTRLERHEQHHVRIAERGAEAVRQFLGGIQGECATMDAVVNQRVRTIVDEWDETNRHYDVQTEHGRTEGAIWPLRTNVAGR